MSYSDPRDATGWLAKLINWHIKARHGADCSTDKQSIPDNYGFKK